MPIAFYMDAHIPRAITLGLRMRKINVLTAQEDKADTLPDPELMDRATQLDRVFFTFDDDLLAEAVKGQRGNITFGGVIYTHPLRISIGKCIQDLELIGKACDPEDLKNDVVYLPL